MVIAAKVEEQQVDLAVVMIKETEKETCVHRWVIEEAKGPTSMGECKNCFEVKEFNNYVESRSEWTKSLKPFAEK